MDTANGTANGVEGAIIRISSDVSGLAEQLERLEAKIDALTAQARDDAMNPLMAYPKGFIPVPQVAELLGVDLSRLYKNIREGKYHPDDVVDIAPEGSERPSYRLNIRGFFARRMASGAANDGSL